MKQSNIENLIQFQLLDNCVLSGGFYFHLLRYFPPNTDTMTPEEIDNEIEKLAALFNSLERPVSMFATDKVEDLTGIRNFYFTLDPKFDPYVSEIVSQIDSTSSESTSVQRAFYFIFCDTEEKTDLLNTLIAKGYRVEYPTKNELATLMRNYFLREFVNCDIYTLEQEILKDEKLRKAIEKKPLKIHSELERRLVPHRLDFLVYHAMHNNIRRRTLMVNNLPSSIPQAALMKVATMKNTSFMMRMTPMSGTNIRNLTNAQAKQKAWKRGSREVTDQLEANSEQEQLLEFYNNITRQKLAVFNTSVYIECYGKTDEEVNQVASDVVDALLLSGITVEALVREQKDGFLSVNPLGRDLFLSDSNNLPSTTAAALYPFTYSSRIDEKGMLLGSSLQGGPLFLDILTRQSGQTNSNFAIVGTAGMGKSYLMKKIITFLTMFGVSCFTLDPEDEYIDLYRNLGGTVYNCVEGAARINPLEVRCLRRADEDEDEGAKDDILFHSMKDKAMFFQHLSWLKDFFSVLFSGISPTELSALMMLTQEMYAANGISEGTDFSKLTEKDYPTFGDLYEFIERYDVASSRLVTESLISGLLLRLRECYDGAMSILFNGHTNIKNANMINFSVAALLEGSKDRTQAVLFNITTWIWTQVTKRERSIAFNIDELYLFFENLTMVKYISSFVRRARKYNSLIGTATQQVADCLREDIAMYTAALFNVSTYKFLFYPGEIDLDMMKEKLKLSDGEMLNISKPRKKHCLVCAGDERYYIKVGSFQYENELFGTAGGK